MYFSSLLHGHGTSAWPGSSGMPTEWTHGTNSPSAPSTSSAALPMRVIDAHARRDVGRVGELHADVRDRRAERTHRERHDVQRAAAHRARVEAQHLGAHLGGVAPVVRRAGVDLVLAADERAVLDAGDVAGVAAGVEAVRSLGRVERRERARLDEAAAQRRRTRPSEPSHQWTWLGLEDRGPVLDPVDQLAIGGRRSALVRDRARHGDASPSGSLGRSSPYRGEMFRVCDGRRIPPNLPKPTCSPEREPGLRFARLRSGFVPPQERRDDRQCVHPHPDRGRQGIGRGGRGARARRRRPGRRRDRPVRRDPARRGRRRSTSSAAWSCRRSNSSTASPAP